MASTDKLTEQGGDYSREEVRPAPFASAKNTLMFPACPERSGATMPIPDMRPLSQPEIYWVPIVGLQSELLSAPPSLHLSLFPISH
ncbi:Vomeronasal Type-1 Receptor 3 [Manis pentadactyla]|nr:Vomeronasal Type-1 Receptor 3 [Manis pentadactyla]